MKLDLFEYDPEKEKETLLFSLTLENGVITSSNQEGKDYLQGLLNSYELGLNFADGDLYAEGKYDEFFEYLLEKTHPPYFYAKEAKQ